MSSTSYVVTAILAGAVGFGAGISLAVKMERPKIAYERKIEGDERQFLVIEANGTKLPFVRYGTNEPFKRLDISQEQEKSRLEETLLKK